MLIKEWKDYFTVNGKFDLDMLLDAIECGGDKSGFDWCILDTALNEAGCTLTGINSMPSEHVIDMLIDATGDSLTQSKKVYDVVSNHRWLATFALALEEMIDEMIQDAADHEETLDSMRGQI
jgi:hypothetical protein